MTDARLDPAHKAEGFIITFTGEQIELLNPKVNQIHIVDIAHALACQSRFNGNGILPINLAMHCINVCNYAGGDTTLRMPLKRLLHDAAEAYLGDMVAPLKYAVGLERYKEIEAMWEKVIAERFALKNLYDDDVRNSDIAALWYETKYMNTNATNWKIFEGQNLDTKGMVSLNVSYHSARKQFMDLFQELTNTEYLDMIPPRIMNHSIKPGDLVFKLGKMDTYLITSIQDKFDHEGLTRQIILQGVTSSHNMASNGTGDLIYISSNPELAEEIR